MDKGRAQAENISQIGFLINEIHVHLHRSVQNLKPSTFVMSEVE
jgi:hypothetical protein